MKQLGSDEPLLKTRTSNASLPKHRGQRKRVLLISAVTVLVLVVLAIIVIVFTLPDNTRSDSSPLYIDDYPQPSSSKEGQYTEAAVASDVETCSIIGRDLLKKGGSAVDAAVGVSLCCGLFNPQSAGLGGGSFMTVYIKETKEATFFDFREKAPLAATETMFVNRSSLSLFGGLAIATPGEIPGIYLAQQAHGKLNWSEVVQPTIDVCERGIVVTKALADVLPDKAGLLANDTELGKIFAPDGKVLNEGDTYYRPKFLKTLRQLSANPTSFYTENSDTTRDMAQDILDAGGIVTSADLSDNFPLQTAAKEVRMVNRNLTALVAEPPSSGLLVGFILALLDGFEDLGDSENMNDLETTGLTYHRILEAMRFAYGKRSGFGDGLFVDMTQYISNLTSQEYIDGIRQLITESSHSYTYYDPAYESTPPDAGTSHLSVLAPNGDAVSMTSTINTAFGSLVMGNRTGIIFNNEMDDFSTPGESNYFGFPASPSNYIKPRKRPQSSMSPTIIIDDDGDVRLVVGASGGSRIISGTAMVAIHNLFLGKSIKESIDFPRLHDQLQPDNVANYDPTFPQEWINQLLKRNHTLVEKKLKVNVNAVSKQNGALFANSDYRKGGAPAGY